MTLAAVQTLFRREFPAEQQLLARALAALIEPNCFPDVPYTQLTRGTAVYKLTVSDHFDAGDVIIRRGEKLDAKTCAALAALNEKLKANPPAPPTTTAAAPAPPKPVTPAPPAPAPTRKPAIAPQTSAGSPAAPAPNTGFRHHDLILTLAGVSMISLLLAGWQFFKERKRVKAAVSVAQVPLPFPDPIKDNLTPQVAQAVREAVQQELAMQRRELLMAQQSAAKEIAALVQRLDELQVPMQERLQAYEARIHMLEKELALRNDENRELLKMKIEMTNRQLETERAAALVPPISAP
jgi:hypothetical protein